MLNQKHLGFAIIQSKLILLYQDSDINLQTPIQAFNRIPGLIWGSNVQLDAICTLMTPQPNCQMTSLNGITQVLINGVDGTEPCGNLYCSAGHPLDYRLKSSTQARVELQELSALTPVFEDSPARLYACPKGLMVSRSFRKILHQGQRMWFPSIPSESPLAAI